MRTKYYHKRYPPARLYHNLASGEIHIFLGSKKVLVYEGKTLYSKLMITQIDLRVYTIGQKELPTTKEGLIGKKLITLRGYGYDGLIEFLELPENNIILNPANSHEPAFKMLEAGRVDYLLDYKKPAEKVLRNNPVQNLKFSSISKVDAYFVISKETPNAEDVLRRMEDAYMQLKDEGKIELR